MKTPKVICLERLGGGGQKNFCAMLVRDGNRIHHYVPNSGEKMGSPPWVIVTPGPQTHMVPDG